MRNAVIPCESRAAVLAESRNERAQLGMHRSAVIALVVVLDEDLPVRLDVVDDLMPNAHIAQRVTSYPLGNGAELLCQRDGRRVAQVDEYKATPGVQLYGHQGEGTLGTALIETHMRCCSQRAIQVVVHA